MGEPVSEVPILVQIILLVLSPRTPRPFPRSPRPLSSLSSSYVLAQCTSPCVILNLTFVMHRYEERIIELHSVIAELSKKMEEEKDDVIKEESECDESQV